MTLDKGVAQLFKIDTKRILRRFDLMRFSLIGELGRLRRIQEPDRRNFVRYDAFDNGHRYTGQDVLDSIAVLDKLLKEVRRRRNQPNAPPSQREIEDLEGRTSDSVASSTLQIPVFR